MKPQHFNFNEIALSILPTECVGVFNSIRRHCYFLLHSFPQSTKLKNNNMAPSYSYNHYVPFFTSPALSPFTSKIDS